MSPRFNYIITIHNKEDLIEQVLMTVLMCCRDRSHIYTVLDGCTDGSEEIIDAISRAYAGVPVTKIHTPDVHELLSIDAALRVADQAGDGYNIVLQDDVILADFMLERKVAQLYEWAGPKLGYVSFRFGANFKTDAASSNEPIPLTDWAENAYAHFEPGAEMVLPGQFTYRHVPIKSPVCFPFSLVRNVGLLDERLAPHSHDDTEYAIRCIKAGYRNGVFPIRFVSDVKWGGTRIKPHPQIAAITRRNIATIRAWHGTALAEIARSRPPQEIFDVPGAAEDAAGLRDARDAWERSQKALQLESGVLRKSLRKAASVLKTVARQARRTG